MRTLRFAILIAAAALMPSALRAQLTIIANEDFAYTAGTLAGKNGGTGWLSAWVRDYGAGISLAVSATGLTYTGLDTSGGSLTWTSGGNGISEASRTLPLMDTGVVYLQFLSQFGSSSGGGTPNVRLLNSGTLTGGFGGNGGTYGTKMSILNASLSAAADGSSSSSANLSALNLVVARIDYANQNTKMWVNPNLSTFDYENPPTANATYAGLAPAFNGIALYTRNPGKFDEITVMTMAVPEPASASLAMAILVLLGTGARAIYQRC